MGHASITQDGAEGGLAQQLRPGEPLIWTARPTRVGPGAWLPGCMAVPFLLVGAAAATIAIGSLNGRSDNPYGGAIVQLLGAVGGVLLIVGIGLVALPFVWRARMRRTIWGLTDQQLLRTGGGRVTAIDLDRVVEVRAREDSDGGGTLTLRVAGGTGGRVVAHHIAGIPAVETARRLIEEHVAAARG